VHGAQNQPAAVDSSGTPGWCKPGRRRHVDQSETDSGHDLDHEAEQGAAAEDVNQLPEVRGTVMAAVAAKILLI